MITYVNSVFVSNVNASILSAFPAAVQSMNAVSGDKGKFIIMNCDKDATDPFTVDQDTQTIKIGMVQGKNTVVRKPDGSTEYQPMIKWSNEIRKHDIKSLRKLTYKADTEDVVTIDFSNVDASVLALLSKGYKRVVVRLTFKDLPTRYRKWTESYEYVTSEGDDAAAIAQGIANEINGQWKRARVSAVANGATVVLTALPYDDDDAVDTLNWANKGRFNVNMWLTDPEAPGFASKNKYAIKGATISKVPGKWYAASAKLVRDRESQALGYDGILNRGNGTWPIIAPALETNLQGQYDALTLEFENMYRAADDIFRKTKQTVEIYVPSGSVDTLADALEPFTGEAYVEPIA